ncbi:MAG: MFS transporter [Chromatiaceae bacterium]
MNNNLLLDANPDSTSTANANAAYRKIAWRLLPLLGLCYILAYLDRINIGFAKLQMSADLGFSEAVYGLGAGIFFIGYFLFEVPSNVILHKVGARRWIARIMMTWGLVSLAMMWVTTAEMFYFLRFLLGIAEAGFFPGIILYLTYWFPAERRGRINALFMIAIALAGLIGGPLSGWILDNFDGHFGWAAWQWLFLLEGLPPIFMGLVILFWLDDRIADAKWLTPNEKALLAAPIAAEEARKPSPPIREVLTDGHIWWLSSIYFCLVMGLYGLGFWLPSLLRDSGTTDPLMIGLLSAIPYALAIPTMVLVGKAGDRRGERRWTLALPALAGALGLGLSVVWADHPWLALAALSLATMGIMSALPAFWSLPAALLSGTAAAAGIALINALGNLAGFLGPVAIGWLRDTTQNPEAGMPLLILALVLGAILVLRIPARLVNDARKAG